MMMRLGQKIETKVNTNVWMTTYTDLVILLLTFFVLLVSMSVITDEKRLTALSSVTGAFGFRPGGKSVIGSTRGSESTVGSAPMKREEADFQKINLGLKNALETDMTVVKEEERIIITLSNKVLFKPGSSHIDPDGSGFLSDLGGILKESPSRIELRGYSDFSESVLDPDPLKASMILSTRRALAIYRFFREDGGISPERITAHGFGLTAAGRGSVKEKHEFNRQVEIILDYKEQVPYRFKRQRGDSTLDFKGFLFRVPGGGSGS